MDEKDLSKVVPLETENPYALRINLGENVSDSEVLRALTTGEIGFLHSFTTGSTVDGPGIRLVAWTSGCQFRCLYCHNPDTWKLKNGIPVTLAKATEELSKYSAGLKTMGGGFTLSGGEPLMQDRFAVRLFTAAKKMGIHTALDTNGSFGSRLSGSDLDMIDLVLLDIKSWEPENHRRITGHGIAPVIEFAERLALNKKPVWIRFVMVPGYTDNPDEVKKIAGFTSGLGNVQRVDVLPFHQMGKFKWKELNLNYELENLEVPSTEAIQEVCSYFRAEGLKTY